MNNEKLKSIIYISKRCPHCRKLLLLLQNKPELKGSIQITCVDDEPFPKIIKSVPTMISNGEIWNSDELFAALEGRVASPGQQPHQPQQPQQPQQSQQPQQGQVDELEGYFSGGGLGGSGLGFASIDDNIQVKQGSFASIDENDSPIDVENDGYIKKNKKMNEFDNDYERMMSERGEIGGGMRMGG